MLRIPNRQIFESFWIDPSRSALDQSHYIPQAQLLPQSFQAIGKQLLFSRFPVWFFQQITLNPVSLRADKTGDYSYSKVRFVKP